MGVTIMLAIWVIIGLLIGILAGFIWKDSRPISESGDIIVSIIASILTGLADWYLLPLMGMEGAIRFIAAIAEPAIVALLVLWAIRRFKK